MKGLEFFKIWAGCLIIYDKPNWKERNSSWEASKLVIVHNYFDFALKWPIVSVRVTAG